MKNIDESLVSPDYSPTLTEPYMNPLMIAYFKKKLLDWRSQLLEEAAGLIHTMKDETLEETDPADCASTELDRSFELRKKDRERKLLSKIDEALQRIEDGNYGYCEETGDPIGIKRLNARPVATLSIEAQERHERLEKTQRDQRR